MIEMGFETGIMQQVLSGAKTVEGRLRTGKFLTLRKGDKISLREDVWENDRVVRSTHDVATAEVTTTDFYDSFADMLYHNHVSTVMPQVKSIEAALQIYDQYYTPQQIAEHGVVAISFTLL